MVNDMKKMAHEIDDKLHKVNETDQLLALFKNEIQQEIDTTVTQMLNDAKTELQSYSEKKL